MCLRRSSRALLREEELYFGGTDGLLADTLTTLIQNYLGPVNYFGEETKNLFLAPVFILLLLAVSRNLFEGVQRREFSPGFFFAGLLALTALGQFLQHELLGTRYLIHRTALLYFPLLALTSFFLVKRAENWVKLALLLPIAIHFLNRANVEMVQEWWYDPYTEEAFEYIVAREPEDSTIRLGSFWLFTPTFQYYKYAGGYKNIIGPNVDFEVPGHKYFDYYYLFASDTAKLHPDYILEKSYGGYCIMKMPPEKKEKR